MFLILFSSPVCFHFLLYRFCLFSTIGFVNTDSHKREEQKSVGLAILIGEWFGQWHGSRIIYDVRMVVEGIEGQNYRGTVEYIDTSSGRVLALYTQAITFNNLTGEFQSRGTRIEGGGWFVRTYRIEASVRGNVFTGRSLPPRGRNLRFN